MLRILALIAFLAPSLAFAQTDIVKDNWGWRTLEWNNGSQIYFRYGIFNSDGKVMICAAVTSRRNVPIGLMRAALKQGFLQMDNTKILRNVSFARLYSSKFRSGNLVGQEADCKVTDTPSPNSQKDIYVDFPNIKYRY